MSKVCFGDVVRDVKINVDRANNPYAFYIAGDHMDTEELCILRRGAFSELPEPGPAFIRIFKKGQILYGSRRTYLKKVAVADFDGVTANTTFVLETKDNSVFLQDLLPFLMYSERFTRFSINNSKGSTNPYILFSDLAKYEFELPSLSEQRKLADLLWEANSTREAYKKVFSATDELVKSRFVEMFGDPVTNPMGWEIKNLGKLFVSVRNGANIKQGKSIDGIPITRIETISDRAVNRFKMGYAGINDITPYGSYVLQDGDILMSHINSIAHLGKTALYRQIDDEVIIHGMNLLCLRPIEGVNKVYIYQFFQTSYFMDMIATITKPAVNQASFTTSDIKAIPMYVPPLDLQNRFADFVRQADKSKFAVEKLNFYIMMLGFE